MARTTKHTPRDSPAEYTRLVSGIYNSVSARTLAEIEARRAARKLLRKPAKDESPDERRQRERENKADSRAMRRALGLPAKGRLTAEQKRRLQIEREHAAMQAKLERETPEFLARERELHRKQQARRAKENPDGVAEAQRKWKAKQSPELFREYERKRYELHAEKIKERARARYRRRTST